MICEEFIEHMGSKVLAANVTEIQKSKGTYFSVSVDSTAGVMHINQLTFILQYVKNAVPNERFFPFIPNHGHKADHLAYVTLFFKDNITSFFKDNIISLMNHICKSQDNAANMSGHYSGLQDRLKEQKKHALYAPCAGHSINFVGVQKVYCNLDVTIYFDFVQNLHSFFSSSTHSSDILVSHLGPQPEVVKHLSETRWSAHVHTVTTLIGGYKKIKNGLDALLNDINQQGLRKKMDELETNFFIAFLE